MKKTLAFLATISLLSGLVHSQEATPDPHGPASAVQLPTKVGKTPVPDTQELIILTTWEKIPPRIQNNIANKFLKKDIKDLTPEDQAKGLLFFKSKILTGKHFRELILLKFDKNKDGEITGEELQELQNNASEAKALKQQATNDINKMLEKTETNGKSQPFPSPIQTP